MAAGKSDKQDTSLSLEKMKIHVESDGVSEEVPALSPRWVKRISHRMYEPPPLPDPDGSFPLGAKEAWLERIDNIVRDLDRLLRVPQYRFWSQILFYEDTLNMVTSPIQYAVPYYVMEEFPQDEDMWNAYQNVLYLAFLVVKRLATPYESETQYITPDIYGKLIYKNYIFCIPMILEFCMCFGKENRSEVQKIISTVFQHQPRYFEDLEKSASFILKVFRFVELKFGGEKIPEGELVKLADRPNRQEEMTLIDLKDMVLHVLDTASSVGLLLDIYTPACKVFHEQQFDIRIAHFYESTVPQMFRKLSALADKEDTQHIFVDLKFKLDLARIELLKVFRLCLSSCLNVMFENIDSITEAEVKKHVDDYVGVLTECLTEKLFITDYHSHYPVDQDLDALSQICPEMDFMKCDFILEAVLACFDVPNQKKDKVKGLMEMRSRRFERLLESGEQDSGIGSSAESSVPKKQVTGIQLDSLITEVKDILPHLGDGFVEKCLEYFDFTSESVINAILEGNLPADLKTLDEKLPRIPRDNEVEEAAIGMQRLNVFDNDEFDIMTRDHVDTSRIHKGKRKDKFKNLIQLIDDKSHRTQFREMYSKFGLVDTEGSMYDDEYDDTYDHVDVSVGDDDPERRPFVQPRILQTKNEENESEEESGEEETAEPQKARDEFVPNPEEIRAKQEQKRQQRIISRGRGWRSGPPKDKDVVGQPRGRGQDKQVVNNRDHKNVHKSTRANHNRRVGAQRKRQQGMMPF